METRHLKFFATVVECGSVTKAADLLQMTQPGLSRIIKRLEDEFGVALFDRSGRGMELTPYGRALRNHCSDLERTLSDIRTELLSLKEGDGGEISIGCGARWVNGLLPLAVSKMVVRRPNVQIRIQTGEWNFLMEQVTSGELDFLLGALPEVIYPDLVCQKIVVDRMFLTARRNHPLTLKGEVTLQDTLDYKWIMPRADDVGIQRTMEKYIEGGLPFPRAAVKTVSRNAAIEILRNTDLLCLLPDFQINQTGKGLAKLNCPDLIFSREGGVIYRKNRPVLAVMDELISELQSIATKLTGSSEIPPSEEGLL